MPKPHDRGGWPTEEPVPQGDHKKADWERQTHALSGALREKGLINTDQMRRGIEAIPPERYESLSYYERWAYSLESLLIEKGVLTKEEIDREVRALESRWR